MVTAEAALVIPVLLAVTLTLSWAIAVGAAQVKLIDAAREGARLAARGETAAVVDAAIRRAGPAGTSGSVTVSGSTVSVRVQADVSPELPLLGDVGGISLGAEATAAAEEASTP
jgi:Flp pilus assembly protein TadG